MPRCFAEEGLPNDEVTAAEERGVKAGGKGREREERESARGNQGKRQNSVYKRIGVQIGKFSIIIWHA